MPMPELQSFSAEPTAEERAGHYSAALDSVALINGEAPSDMELGPNGADGWKATLERNVEHLEIMVAKTWWAGEDLGPLNAAIAAGKAKIAAL